MGSVPGRHRRVAVSRSLASGPLCGPVPSRSHPTFQIHPIHPREPAARVRGSPPNQELHLSKKIMLINATDSEEIRVATLVDGVLSDFEVEFVHNETIKGNIYRAKVVRVDQSLQAAFVHYGGQKNGFLPIGELPRDLVSPDGRRGRIQDLLNRDQEMLVQAVREELGSKGAMLTAQISLPGRYLVLTPGNPLNGISRKIESREEREYFKRLIDELEIPKNMGVIVRTASLGVTKDDFQRDLEYLLDTYKEVQTRYKHRHSPGLVWQEDDVVTRTLRDCFSADMDEVHIDDLETFHTAQHFFRRTMPQHLGVLRHYIGKKPLFSKFATDEQIDRIYARKVALPSGGAIVLDQTEALVAIDVNSGKTSGDGVEDMAFKTNMEAAEEAARQLRLRDLAGLVVIDFIDMKREGHLKSVQDQLVECLREDKARMEVGKINRFGVLVMTRQRIRPSIQQVNHETCPTCQGLGRVKTPEALVLSVVRRLKAILSRGDVAEVRIKLAPPVALAVLNAKRRDLAEMEEQHESRITILADPETGYGAMTAEIERREEEPAEKVQAERPPERRREPEEDTVVLGGDSPISFEKALADDPRRVPVPEIKVERRDAQRAALEERERLRALFESAKPEGEDAVEGEPAVEPPAKSGRSRRGRGKGKGGATESPIPTAPPAEVPEPSLVWTVAEVPAAPETPAPVFNVADLLAPAPRPRLLGSSETTPAPKGRPKAAKPAAERKSRTPAAAKAVEAPPAAPKPVVPKPTARKAAAPKAAAKPVAPGPEVPTPRATPAPKATSAAKPRKTKG
jgi:ribonuclease E